MKTTSASHFEKIFDPGTRLGREVSVLSARLQKQPLLASAATSKHLLARETPQQASEGALGQAAGLQRGMQEIQRTGNNPIHLQSYLGLERKSSDRH